MEKNKLSRRLTAVPYPVPMSANRGSRVADELGHDILSRSPISKPSQLSQSIDVWFHTDHFVSKQR
jgi:hypothetical protein